LRYDRANVRPEFWRHFLAWEHEARRSCTYRGEFEPGVQYQDLPSDYNAGIEDEDDGTAVVVKQQEEGSSSAVLPPDYDEEEAFRRALEQSKAVE
jgi:hypothetical protein